MMTADRPRCSSRESHAQGSCILTTLLKSNGKWEVPKRLRVSLGRANDPIHTSMEAAADHRRLGRWGASVPLDSAAAVVSVPPCRNRPSPRDESWPILPSSCFGIPPRRMLLQGLLRVLPEVGLGSPTAIASGMMTFRVAVLKCLEPQEVVAKPVTKGHR